MTGAARAGLARRLASLSYEALLLIALVLLANFVLLPVVSSGHATNAHGLTMPDVPERALLSCALFATAAVYFVWSWSGGRRTLPMKTWRMRIVDSAGAPLGYRRAFLRYLAAWIGPGLALTTYLVLQPIGLAGVALVPLALNYLAAFVDPEGQFLHDRIAGTRIVLER